MDWKSEWERRVKLLAICVYDWQPWRDTYNWLSCNFRCHSTILLYYFWYWHKSDLAGQCSMQRDRVQTHWLSCKSPRSSQLCTHKWCWSSMLNNYVLALKGISDFWEAIPPKGVWRCVARMTGVQYVILHGLMWMLELLADNWDYQAHVCYRPWNWF